MWLSIFMTIFSLTLIVFGFRNLRIMVSYVSELWNEANGKDKALALIGMICCDIEIAWGIYLFVKYVIL